jgi:hypothetical protein
LDSSAFAFSAKEIKEASGNVSYSKYVLPTSAILAGLNLAQHIHCKS